MNCSETLKMFETNRAPKMLFKIVVMLFTLCSVTNAKNIHKPLSFVNFVKVEPPIVPSTFDKPLYQASLSSNNSLQYLDGPITISNFRDDMYLVVSAGHFADVQIRIVDTEHPYTKIVQLEPIVSHPLTKSVEVLLLEGLDDKLIPICRTSVIVDTNTNEVDMYRMTFMMDGQEYIVLNYFYFKCFLGLMTVTGLLILIIELHEVIVGLRKRRLGIPYEQIHSI